jgi:PAS domain S-box-containing protein
MSGPPTVVVVDDADEVRALIRTRLRLSGRLEVVGEGGTGGDAIALAQQHQPGLMLLDVSMPEMDGLEALPQVLAASPGTRVVMYSGFEEHGLAQRTLELGASAFLEKSTPLDTLADQLLTVLAAAAPSHQAAPGPPAEPEAETTGRLVDFPHEDHVVVDDHLERFREVFEEAAIGMATLTLAGRIVRANRALGELVRQPVEALVGVPYGDLTSGRETLVDKALEGILHESLDVVQIEHTATGSKPRRRVLATMAPIRDSTGRPLYLFLQVQDVTMTRATEEELRRSEERFRLLVDAVDDYAIFMLDPQGHVVSWNTGAEAIKGYRADEIIGRHFSVFYTPEQQAARHPEHELELAIRDGHYEEEGWRIRKDGTRFWANVVITTVRNSEGVHIGFTKVTRDTTERRQMLQQREEAAAALAAANEELEALNERLRQAAEDQSQFLAVTAHELRTPVGVLGGTADTLAQHWEELTDEERTEMLDGMTASAARLRRLLSDLLTASRLQKSALQLHPVRVRVADVVSKAAATAQRMTPDADVTAEADPDVEVLADPDRLLQAVDNLVSNALRYGAQPVRLWAGADPADGVVQIRVTDSGSGVDEALRPRLFERFATGGRKGGTGLGLFIVRELARAHSGDAWYEPPSAEDPAGAFVLSLPPAPHLRPE